MGDQEWGSKQRQGKRAGAASAHTDVSGNPEADKKEKDKGGGVH